MPRNSETSNNVGFYFNLPNPGLKSYFGNVVKGQPNIYDTPFAKGESTQELLSKWDAELQSISDKWPTLYEFEKDLAEKVGPMSIMLPLNERMDDIKSYYEGILLPSKPISDRAIKAVLAEWSSVRGLRIRGQLKTVEKMKKSTNSGSPFFTKRRNVVNETVPCRVELDKRYGAVQYLNTTRGRTGSNHWGACAVLGWRGQEGGPEKDDVKQRVVWMFPFAVNVAELCVYQPLIEKVQSFELVPAWVSMECVDQAITRLFDTKADNDLVVCTDFTKFDQHFNPSCQFAARQLLDGILSTGTESMHWLNEVFPIKYRIPLMYDWGKIKHGLHGMGSGSGGTNADETLVHRALQYEAAQNHNAKLNPNSQCLGDDGVLSYPGITVEDVVKAYSAHGLEMNKSKQYASTQDLVYLRRWHHKDYRMDGVCVGVYSTNRALGRLRYLERFMDPEYWGPEMVALRQLSIMENVKNHPLREQFAQFCMRRDKYRLGLDIPGFMDNLAKLSKEAIDHMPDFMGYTKTLQSEGKDVGINNWWIVNYLKSIK